eukprot:TRINITY_DN2397_c0_g2_i1.p1 TRINITY_DN2397_c0_g2~~TRINITY_DN2397_c0_g2_i1.p1  ORF type:complete len:960 (+),score=250.72 TRINITY_DN2397_c0_g2_i1:60-2939(+)
MAPHNDYNLVTSDGVTIKTAAAALEKANYFKCLFDTDCEENDTGTINLQHRNEDFSYIHNMLIYDADDIMESYRELSEVKRVLLIKNLKYYGLDSKYIAMAQGWGKQCVCPAYKLVCLLARKAISSGTLTYDEVVACGNSEMLATTDMSASVNNSGETPLMFAIDQGNTELVKEIAASGCDLDILDNNGVPVLIKVIRARQEEIARILITQGANVNVTDNNVTPIAVAIATNQLEIVKYLTAVNADLKIGGHSYLCTAIGNSNYEMVRTLLMAGADYDCCDQHGVSPIRKAIENNAPANVIHELIDCGADISSEETLISAVESGNVATMQLLVKEGSPVSAKAITLCIRNAPTEATDEQEDAAVASHWEETLTLLLDNCKEGTKASPSSTIAAAISAKWLPVVRQLFDAGFVLDKEATDAMQRDLAFTSRIVEGIKSGSINVTKEQFASMSTLLFTAVKREDIQLFSDLLSFQDIPIDDPNGESLLNFVLQKPLISIDYLECIFKHRPQPVTTSMLISASSIRNIASLNFLLEKCEDVKAVINQTLNGTTCLLEAIKSGNTDSVYRLVECGADLSVNTVPDTPDTKLPIETIKNTAVYLAAQQGSMPMLKYILSFHDRELKNKRNVENELIIIPKEIFVAALEVAVEKSFYKVVVELLQFDIDIKTYSPNLLSKATDPQIVDKLVLCGASVTSKTGEKGKTPLLLAFQKGDKVRMANLIKAGADPNEKLPKGWHLLHLATLKGINYVDILLNANADTEVTYKGQTPLHFAIKRNSYPVTKRLIEAGADFNKVCDFGTPLNMSIQHKDRKIMKELIQAGANASNGNIQNDKIDHPLSQLIRDGDVEGVSLVLTAGADVNVSVSVKEFETPLMLACRTCNLDILKILVNAGANVNAARPDGWSALFQALTCPTVSTSVIEFLLEAGAKANKKCGSKTPLTVASTYCSKEVIEIIKKASSWW